MAKKSTTPSVSLSFHASKKAPSQRKKRDKTSRYVYNLIVTEGKHLYDENLFHPEMQLPPQQMATILHNVGRLVADEITSLNKFNLTNEIPLLMQKSINETTRNITNIKKIVKKSHDNTNKSTTSMAKKKQPLAKKR